jgi:hypothetical protein
MYQLLLRDRPVIFVTAAIKSVFLGFSPVSPSTVAQHSCLSFEVQSGFSVDR